MQAALGQHHHNKACINRMPLGAPLVSSEIMGAINNNEKSNTANLVVRQAGHTALGDLRVTFAQRTQSARAGAGIPATGAG